MDEILYVEFNPNNVMVIWEDGVCTIVNMKSGYNHELGLLKAIAKKHFSNTDDYEDWYNYFLTADKKPEKESKQVDKKTEDKKPEDKKKSCNINLKYVDSERDMAELKRLLGLLF